MGQIFDRIYRIAMSHSVGSRRTPVIDLAGDDEDLKHMIDSLSADGGRDKSRMFDFKNYNHQRHIVNIHQAYSVLGVPFDATEEEIRSSYRKKMMEYHPDRVTNLGEDIRALAGKKTAQINEAFYIIKSAKGFS